MQLIPIKDLTAGDGVNVRKDRTAGIESLAKSIEINGLLQSLLVREAKGKFEVIAGNRRLSALKPLIKEKKKAPSDQVPCIVIGKSTDADAVIYSLVENVDRLPLHEVDQYEAFAALWDMSMTEGEIASRYGVSELFVKQRLALGQLSPKVRAAWRAGELRAEGAMAFTLARDHAQQDKVLAAAEHQWQRSAHSIKSALDLRQDMSAELTYVGLEAYAAAGGQYKQDLFSDETYVLDPPVLEKLFREKLQERIESYLKDGWSFCRFKDDLPDWYRYRQVDVELSDEDNAAIAAIRQQQADLEAEYEQQEDFGDDYDEKHEALEAQIDAIRGAAMARLITPDLKQRTGVLLELQRDGVLTVTEGVEAPKDAKAPKQPVDPQEGDKQEPKKDPWEISAPLASDLSEQTTQALSALVKDSQEIALALLATQLIDKYWHGPARISAHNSTFDPAPWDLPGKAKDIFEAVRKMPVAKVCKLLTELVAGTIDVRTATIMHKGNDEPFVKHLFKQMDGRKALQEAFDPAHYFEKQPKITAEAALKKFKKQVTGKKKGEIAAQAAEAAKEAGWLPPSMEKLVK